MSAHIASERWRSVTEDAPGRKHGAPDQIAPVGVDRLRGLTIRHKSSTWGVVIVDVDLIVDPER
jgi:hypothetical protein